MNEEEKIFYTFRDDARQEFKIGYGDRSFRIPFSKVADFVFLQLHSAIVDQLIPQPLAERTRRELQRLTA